MTQGQYLREKLRAVLAAVEWDDDPPQWLLDELARCRRDVLLYEAQR